MHYNQNKDIIEQISSIEQPTSICIVVTRNCQLHCPYCLNPLVGIVPIPFSMNILELINSWNPMRIVLTGGEPTLDLDLLDTIGSSLAKRGHHIVVSTNGLLNEELIRFNWLARVSVSIPAVTRKTYEIVRGSDSFPQVLRGLKILNNAGVPITIAYTVTEYNLLEIPSSIDFALTHGASVLAFEMVYNVGRGAKCLGQPTKQNICNAFKKVSNKDDIKVLMPAVGEMMNLIKKGLIVIEADGLIYNFVGDNSNLITSTKRILSKNFNKRWMKTVEANHKLFLIKPENSRRIFNDWCRTP